MRDSLAIYVHLPYCARRCPYCDFNTYVVHSIPEDRYVATLLREARFAAAREPWAGRPVSSIFFGGGTPSLFSPSGIGRLLEGFAACWPFAADVEISMEANPGSLEGGGEQRLRDVRSAGVTRLSFGAQSFDARHLATLGRIHGADETRDAFDAARRAGFDNVSCDLIYGVPGQTVADWERDVATAIALGTGHVSAYCLTYEEGTPMTGMKRAGLIEAADEDTELEMYRVARAHFADAGLAQYEISNYARDGRECRHNMAYWSWRDYLGLGAGAHGFAAAEEPAAQSSWGRRYANVRLPEFYMSAADGAWHATEESLSREMAIEEYLMVRLRLAAGVDVRDFERRFSVATGDAIPALPAMIEGGFARRTADAIVLTDRGLELADSVITRLAAA